MKKLLIIIMFLALVPSGTFAAMSFTAASEHRIEYNDNNDLDFTTNMTVAFWFLADDFGANSRNMVKKDGNYIFRSEAGSPRFYWFDGTNIRYGGFAAPTTGVWHHYAVTVVSNDVDITYLDGVAQSTGGTTLAGSGRTLTNTLAIGNQPGGGEAINGDMAEVGIWSVALSGFEVAALAKGFSPILIRPGSLNFYTPLVRSPNDRMIGLLGTVTGATVIPHIRIFNPRGAK